MFKVCFMGTGAIIYFPSASYLTLKDKNKIEHYPNKKYNRVQAMCIILEPLCGRILFCIING